MMTEFSTLDIVKTLKGLHREVLRDWMDRGYIKPSVPAQGQGTKAIFKTQDIYHIALFRKLIGSGFNRETAGLFVNRLTKDSQLKKAGYLFVRTYVNDAGQEECNIQAIASEGSMLTVVVDRTDDIKSTDVNSLAKHLEGGKFTADRTFGELNKQGLIMHIIDYGALRREVDDALKAL